MKQQWSETVVCTGCNGEGVRTHEELDDYHNNIYKTVVNGVCTGCNGSGLVIKTTINEVTYMPFVQAYKDRVRGEVV